MGASMEDWIESELKRLERNLLKAKRQSLLASESWRETVPREPGVYIVWDSQTANPLYVGETANLYKRMSDIGRNANHTFRRRVLRRWKSRLQSDKLISQLISRKCMLSILVVQFGRRELEERLVGAWSEKYDLLNKPVRRATLRSALGKKI